MPLQATMTGHQLILSFNAKMDTSQCRLIEKEVTDRLAGWKGPIIFDLQGVGFVASAFLRLAMQAARQAGAGNFTFANVAPAIKLVLKTAGLDSLIAKD